VILITALDLCLLVPLTDRPGGCLCSLFVQSVGNYNTA
jgi:hypothetical protein